MLTTNLNGGCVLCVGDTLGVGLSVCMFVCVCMLFRATVWTRYYSCWRTRFLNNCITKNFCTFIKIKSILFNKDMNVNTPTFCWKDRLITKYITTKRECLINLKLWQNHHLNGRHTVVRMFLFLSILDAIILVQK